MSVRQNLRRRARRVEIRAFEDDQYLKRRSAALSKEVEVLRGRLIGDPEVATDTEALAAFAAWSYGILSVIAPVTLEGVGIAEMVDDKIILKGKTAGRRLRKETGAVWRRS